MASTVRYRADWTSIDGFEAGTERYTAINEDSTSTPVTSTSKLELPKILTGIGPNLYTGGRLQVYTTAAVWQNSVDDWTVGGESSGGVNINNLLCNEVLAARKQPIRIYSGTIEGNGVVILPMHVLLINSLKYLLRSGQFNANTNTWTGEWSQIYITRSNTNSNYERMPIKNKTIYSDVATQNHLAAMPATNNPVFVGEITLGSTEVSETELGILEGATVTTNELNHLEGVTSDIQDQLDDKAPKAHPVFTGEISLGSTEVSETELGIIEGATITTTELNYVDGVTSALQDQIDNKADK